MERAKYFIVIGIILLFALWLLRGTSTKNVNQQAVYVGSQTVECTGEALQRCLLVKTSPDGEYQPFYDQIEGFSFTSGYEYELLVEVNEKENVIADASSVSYSLVDIVSETPSSYIQITSPETMGRVDTSKEFVVSGKGRGLYENNVVIEITDSGGVKWAPNPTTMETSEIGGEGTWEFSVIPLNTLPDENFIIRIFSPSPKDGEAGFEDIVTAVSAPSSTFQLESGKWSLTSYVDPETGETLEVLPGTEITAEFIKGDVNGSAGCNNYFSTYTTEEKGSLTFGPAGSTLIACAEPILTQEIKYLGNLSLVISYEIDDRTLMLKDGSGDTILVYELL